MPKRHRPGPSAVSVLRHLEDVVVATSGENAFEIIFAVAAARLVGTQRAPLRRAIAEVRRAWPLLQIDDLGDAKDEVVERVDDLLLHALPNEGTLDAVFESLVPRVSKSDKGQFFTPRHVVDFVVRMLAPSSREVVVDPACGSGAFLSRARAFGGAKTYGSDVDARAVRVARLLALAASSDPWTIVRGDGLREADLPVADVVATNPPFAGRAPADGFDVARFVRTPERDLLFLDRSIELLRPGGRLGIVLPYGKASGDAYAAMRRWLASRVRLLATVGLPRETFLPHTAQRTFVLFAQKRHRLRNGKTLRPPDRKERTMLIVSERAGKDSGGEPIVEDGRLDHDLDDVAAELEPFLRAEGFS